MKAWCPGAERLSLPHGARTQALHSSWERHANCQNLLLPACDDLWLGERYSKYGHRVGEATVGKRASWVRRPNLGQVQIVDFSTRAHLHTSAREGIRIASPHHPPCKRSGGCFPHLSRKDPML